MGRLITAGDFKPVTSVDTLNKSGLGLRLIFMHFPLGADALMHHLLIYYLIGATILEGFAFWIYRQALNTNSFSRRALLRWLAAGDPIWIAFMTAMIVFSGKIPLWAWGLTACLSLTIMVVRVILAMGFDIEAFDKKLQRRKQVTPYENCDFLLHQLADFYDEDLLLGRDMKRLQWKVGAILIFTGIAIGGVNGVLAYKAGAFLQLGIAGILGGLGIQLSLSRTLSDWIVILRLEQLYRHRPTASASK